MMYITIIFISPLYFLIRGKWGGFLLNSIFYIAAWLLILTLIGAFLAPLPWMIAVIHGVMAYRKELVEQDATVLATKMAEAMRQQQQPPQNSNR